MGIYLSSVCKAGSLVHFATFRDALENDFSRKIVGFDAFGSFPTDKLEVHELEKLPFYNVPTFIRKSV